ncbi:RICIN domain-containing protein [Streptomyces longwoodensis]|uniref:RICIN domain-containing protein n=1 Tax=Streptomyces longwoodensis TaxID=68231 RepID=UPI0033FC0BC1
MLTPRPPRPPYPPPGGDSGESDESLAAGVRGGPDGEVAESTALLIARHWRPVHDYAVICLASSGSVAAMVTGAAFHQVFDRLKLGEQGTALRPRLLVTVRDTVLLWSGTGRISGVLPALGKPSGARGMRAAKTLVPENRVLAERAYQGLPSVDRAVLWHVEVEAEPLGLAAALLGVDADTAAAALDQARDKLREGLVRAHRELAPSRDCRFYNRLLDVPLRRGAQLLPDVRRHLDACRYCRAAAEQLGHFDGRLGALLAEAVLGWGAGRYLESRPGRSRQQSARLRGAARHRGGRPRRAALRLLDRLPGPARSSRTLLTGVGLASAGLLTTLLAAGMWSDDGGADPAASTSASGGGTVPGSAQLPAAPGETRLRNAAADLCLAVQGTPRDGAPLSLAACSANPAQRWRYEDDGQLRSAAEPHLCVDSRADAGVVLLGACTEGTDARTDDVRYDLTAQGEFLPRWDGDLALDTAGRNAGADLVVTVRDGTPGQRWLTDAGAARGGSLSVSGTGGPTARPARAPGHDA